jgi:hypothetical protein
MVSLSGLKGQKVTEGKLQFRFMGQSLESDSALLNSAPLGRSEDSASTLAAEFPLSNCTEDSHLPFDFKDNTVLYLESVPLGGLSVGCAVQISGVAY